MIASLFRRWRQEDTIEQLTVKCEALKRINARLTQERDTWQETAIQSTKDYNEMHARVEQAQEHILSLELQLAEATSKTADHAQVQSRKRGKQGNSTGTDGAV